MCRIFRENQLAMRTSEKYYQDLEEIEGDGNGGRVTGIKRSGVLIQLLYYHIMNNEINDPMQTVPKGIIPYVLG
jgi:hypothetical protein